MATLLAGIAVVVTASPGGADTVGNPGAVVITVDAGGFFNVGGKELSLPSTSDPVQCSDGVNNDTAIDDSTVPPAAQDQNIDYDGGASQGVSPPTAVDAQCNSGGTGKPASADDSEAKAGFQPRTYLTLNANVDKDGNITAAAGDVTFPKYYVFSKAANGVIDVIPAATGNVTGTVDPTTGKVTLHIDWQIEVIQAFFKIDCYAPISMDLSTDAGDAANGGSIPVTQSALSGTAVTVSGNNFAAGGMVPNPTPSFTPPTSEAGCTNVGSGFGLPAAAGDSAAQLSATLDRTIEPPAANPGIAGTVTASGAGASANAVAVGLPGIVVSLLDPNPGWNVLATTTTDADGKYAFDNLPAGDYAVRFFDPTGTYKRTWYNGKDTYKTGDAITVSTGVTTADQALDNAPSGSISGQAKLGSGAGVPNIRVNVYTEAGGYYASKTTGAGGYYELKGVPAGSYWVWFVDPSHTYLSQWYKFKLLFFNADSVTVGSGQSYVSALLGA